LLGHRQPGQGEDRKQDDDEDLESVFFAALKIRSMFSTVLYSLTRSPTNPQVMPFSLKTSFCGSVSTTAVSFLLMFMVPPLESQAWASLE
jgi:hypothetical protein